MTIRGKYFAELFISLSAPFTLFFITSRWISCAFLCCFELNALCSIYDLYRDYISVISAAATLLGCFNNCSTTFCAALSLLSFVCRRRGQGTGVVMDEIEIAHTPCVSLSVVLTQSMRFCLMLNFLRCEFPPPLQLILLVSTETNVHTV